MTIVGSTYTEKCIFPHWNEICGSGWRAVSALYEHTSDINFYSYLNTDDLKYVKQTPAFKFITEGKINFTFIDQSISFEYFHGLSEPKIYPPLHKIKQNTPLEVRDNVILRYGFLEGSAIVDGEKVVYDPQSAFDPKDFYENGSTAKELVVILNMREALLLTGELDIAKIATKLLVKNTIGIILKEGPAGGKVITRDSITPYNVYKTSFVFPIGSGDVFAAFIAYFWGCQELSLIEASDLASKAVSIYCNTQALPLKKDYQTSKSYIPVIKKTIDKKMIYLAGPFFNMHQRWLIEEARNNLFAADIAVFSPIHDVGRGHADIVVPADIQGIHDSHILFAILDGLDSGTIFEVGYAIAMKKPVVVYCMNESEEDLKMLEGTGCHVVRDFTTAIYLAKWLALEQ